MTDNNGELKKLKQLLLAIGGNNIKTVSEIIKDHPELITTHVPTTKSRLFTDGEVLGTTPLHKSAGVGNVYILNQLIDIALKDNEKKERVLNITNNRGETPTHYAAFNNCPSALFLLLQLGSNINKQNIDGDTPLHLAIIFGNKACTEILLDHPDLKTNIKDNNGKTPFEIAKKLAGGNPANTEILRVIKDHVGKKVVSRSNKIIDSSLEI
jgi:ankyrin repeat protein